MTIKIEKLANQQILLVNNNTDKCYVGFNSNVDSISGVALEANENWYLGTTSSNKVIYCTNDNIEIRKL